MATTGTATLTISEMREFAGFAPCEQRYIRRALDIGLGRGDAFKLWARDDDEARDIRRQYVAYRGLADLRATLPEGTGGLEQTGDFIGALLKLTAFDLTQGRIEGFSAYRFLYERLLGAAIRPWLPSAFCAAAALPQILPERRKPLLQSLSEAAATAPGWSAREPQFFPDYIEDVAA